MGTATQNGEPGKARLGAQSALRAGGAFIAADVGGTNARVAAEFGVSAERIRQIEVKALKKMKLTMIAE